MVAAILAHSPAASVKFLLFSERRHQDVLTPGLVVIYLDLQNFPFNYN